MEVRNNTPVDDQLVHKLFESAVERTPDANAIVYGDQNFAYATLNEKANQVAHALLARGSRPEVRVGLFVERGAEMVAGLLGVLKSGGAYVPLDPSYHAGRLR